MPSFVNMHDLKLRMCALETEMTPTFDTPIASLAFPKWFVKATDFPYWINRSARITSQSSPMANQGDESNVYSYQLITRLVWAHLTAGYEGEVDEAIDDAVPQAIEYFSAREKMQSGAYPASVHYLDDFKFTDGTGYMVFPPSPAGVVQVGAEFIFRCEYVMLNPQVFLGG